MSLPESLRPAFAAALRAETNPTLAGHVASRNDTMIADWCNKDSQANAWLSAATDRDLFEATDVTKFDNLTAGKQASQTRLERFSPLDFTRVKLRKAVLDIWGAADGVAILNGLMRKATRAELMIGGSDATTNGVTALKLTWEGQIDTTDVGRSLNEF